MESDETITPATFVALASLSAGLGGGLILSGDGGAMLAAGLAFMLVAAVCFALSLRRTKAENSVASRPVDASLGVPAIEAQALISAMPDPMVVFDPAGFLLHANPAAELAFGALKPGLSLPLRFRAPEMQVMMGDLLSGSVSRAETQLSERVPVERSFHVWGTALGDGHFALVFHDLGEARRIDRMRSDFVANASHELRTPLAAIAGFVETLRGPARNDEKARDRFLTIIGEQTARMTRLIDDLLSLSRLESRPTLDLGQKVDLTAVVREVAETLGPVAAESGVRLELDVDQVEVGGSRDELVQVVQNLIENACKYGASGGRVLVSLKQADQMEAELSVRDWGAGIASEHLPRVTERFYRADVQSSRAKKGTGLGLSIVKHIATRHHARLTIASEPGKGSLFALRFPSKFV
ncbi:ATP-binding protein [Mesorhizobium sp. RP14(2022)]|uniref:histidine kinase n=1 Tax=Mesorhizobium liriopis TaxID=2953882 RepID=A0ABT1C0M7_9HYPH|nr:ATP-binding protein [Mesorhizobium liriopis]MCO6048322.1 ATP-binding protein [Mesorhizobium liriopis]